MTEPYALQPAWFIAATRDGHVEHCGDCPVVDMLTELLALRPALAVAEQELARLQALPSQLDRAVVRENGTLRGELAAAEAERDQAQADLKRIADRLWREDKEYAAKVTRLAALEAAARAYVAWLADMEAGRQGIMTGRRLLGTLTAAVAALDAVPAAEGEA